MTHSGGSNTNPDPERTDALLGACLEQGEARLEELVEKLCEEHPDRAAAIREEVEAARSAGLRRKPPDGSGAGVPERGAPFERIGPYQPLREIGRGGQGFVYLAEDTRLHRVVALKVLKGFGALSDKVIQRFRREAEVASRLDHPGICSVYDAGVTAGIPYIAMRFVEGQTLADSIMLGRSSLVAEPTGGDLIEFEDDAAPEPAPSTESFSTSTTRKRSEILEIVAIVEKVARALHAAHEAGIIHRDIKPGNIMVTPAGEPVILDFGLASDEANELSLTQTGDLFGTPAYMSPEQLMAQRIRLDRRTDVYSLAVTLYECVTLKRPFDAATREAMYQAIQYKEPSHARNLNREVPVDLETVLERALEKDRDRRYATALDFAEDLRRVRELEPITARRASAAGRLVRWARRRPARAALAAILVIGVPMIAGLASYSVAKTPEIRRGKELALLAQVDRHLENAYDELEHGDVKVAAAAFESALALKPDCGEAIAGEAFALHQTNDCAGLLRFLDEHPVVEGRDFALTKLRFSALWRLGRKAEAQEFARRAPRDSRTPLGFFVAGLTEIQGCEHHNDKKVFRKARDESLRAVLSSHRARSYFHFQLAHAAQHLEEVGPSREIREAILYLWPGSAGAAYHAGAAVDGFDPAAAAASYEEAIALKPDDERCLGRLVQAHIRNGQIDRAVAACRTSIAFQPASAHLELGKALSEMGRIDEAIAAFRKSIEVKPANAAAHSHLGLALCDKGDFDEAIRNQRKAIELDPGMLGAHVNLGHALVNGRRFDDAISSMKKAIELFPKAAPLHGNLGVALSENGNVAEAIAAFRKAIELDPKDAYHSYFQLGLTFGRNGDHDDAMEIWRKMIELQPNDRLPHCNLGVVLCIKGDLDAGITELRRSIELDPNFADPHHTLAVALLNKGDFEAAIPVWRRLIELRPDDPDPGIEGAALDRAGALASDGLDSDKPEDRGKAADMLDALLRGWRQDVDRRRRLEAVGPSLGSLVREEPWVLLRDPKRAEKLPEAERRRWGEIFSAVDDLIRRIQGGN